ncbi:DUF2000 domain-containing protein [uncultured Vibrio sp.]|uniref:DUF2000 domain-containing protein n=1 Tax=uncultured Vibrio sp. TaxID=114054 RepID=UPI00262B4405|nr:DUF2000 domain-containing protein [uncultured Vibrio sp.]
MSNVFENKIVIIIDDGMNKGVTANRAAVLMSGLAAKYPAIVGKSHITRDNISVEGFTQLPVIILTRPEDKTYVDLIKSIRQAGCYHTMFLRRAEGFRSYADYSESISEDSFDELDIDGVVIYGKRKKVDKLTKNFPSLR